MNQKNEAPVVFTRRQFGSDNYSGVCPEAWQSMTEANAGHCPSYGTDLYTRKATDAIRGFFGCDCEVFFTFNGTAANSLALASLCRSYHSIICADTAHVETDECGAPEFFSNGTKVLLVPCSNGKVSLSAVEETIRRRRDIHYPKPRVLSLTQATELGTVYTPDETAAACELAKRHGLRVHVDGARFANALATLQCEPGDVTWRAGVDVLCFGGAKNGIAIGEAVVFFDQQLADEFDYRCKQAGQLASKMRFISAPWVGMLKDRALLKHAAHANACAKRLEMQLKEIAEVEILFPVQANSVFLKIPQPIINRLQAKGWHFYTFIGAGGCRFTCSWDTTNEDVDALTADLRQCVE